MSGLTEKDKDKIALRATMRYYEILKLHHVNLLTLDTKTRKLYLSLFEGGMDFVAKMALGEEVKIV